MDHFECFKFKAGLGTPKPNYGNSVVFYDDSLYVFGYAPLIELPHSKLFRFDLWAHTWEVVNVTGQAPEPRIYHYACIYNSEMYIIYGFFVETLKEYHSIYKFNFLNLTWYKLSDDSGTSISLAADILIGSKLYILYGRNLQTILNSVISIDLSYSPPLREVISPNFINPEARIYHCSVIINQYLYTFGGTDANEDDTQQVFDDMWRFDMINQKWNYVNTLGPAPSKRYDFGCSKTVGDVVAVFGGKGENRYLNDFYFYHETFNTWYQINADGNVPSPRRGACLVYYNYTYFIIGGKNSEKGFNEIWVYSVETNKFNLIEEKIFKNGNDITQAKCWVEDKGENIEITVVGGCNFLAIPNLNTIKIIFFPNNNSVSIDSNYKNKSDKIPYIVAPGSALIKSDNLIFVIGGLLYETLMIIPPRIKNLETSIYTPYALVKKLNLYGSTGVHYEDSFYIFGGSGSAGTYRSPYKRTSNVYKVSFNSSDPIYLGCSQGHYEDVIEKKCKACIPGTYFDKTECKPCPKGKYSQALAASSIEQCLPCPAGTFLNKEGGSICLTCPNGYTCPVGSSHPKSIFEIPKNDSIQPGAYKDKNTFVNFIVKNLWVSAAAIGFFFIMMSFISISFWQRIEKIDLFVAQHSHELGKPVIHKKTKVGGLFSVLFIITCIITAISGFLSYQLDNINEIKALIPLITLEEKVSAESALVYTTFYIYGGACGENFVCDPKIIYEDIGLSYTYRSVECYMINENCEVRAAYNNLKMTQKTSEIKIMMKEKLSYSSAISINMSLSSSIPNKMSSTITSFSTGFEENLFRGTSCWLYYQSSQT